MGNRLREGRQVLPRGREKGLHLLQATRHNEYTVKDRATGADEARGYIMRWVTRRLNGLQPTFTLKKAYPPPARGNAQKEKCEPAGG